MKKALITLLILCSCSYASYAQSSDKLLDKLVEKKVLTNKEANEIRIEEAKNTNSLFEKAKLAYESDADEPVRAGHVLGFNSKYFHLGGYTQLLYNYNSANSANLHNFQAKNIYLVAGGEVVDGLKYSFMFDLADSFRPIEYWLEWTLDPMFALKLGQYKVPLTIESTTGAGAIETINYSRAVTSLLGYGYGLDPLTLQSNDGKNRMGRDIGLQASGSFVDMGNHSLLHYAGGIFQGGGMNTGANTNNKTFAGQVFIEPIKGLRAGGGAMFGEAKYGGTWNGIDLPVEGHSRSRWTASVEYKSDMFKIRSEYIRAKDSSLKREGLYGLAQYYAIPKKLDFLVKVDYLNDNTDFHTEVMDYTFGVGYNFLKQFRVLANYTYTDYSNRWEQGRFAKDSHFVGGQLQLSF